MGLFVDKITGNLYLFDIPSSSGGSGGSGTVNNATNALSISPDFTTVRLGGNLNQNTIIVSSASFKLNFAGYPLQYISDLNANYNPRSLVDYGNVTGITSLLLRKTTFNSYTASTTSILTSIQNTYVSGATNGLSLTNSRQIKFGGNLTGATTIGLGNKDLTFTATTGTLKYGADYSANFTSRSIPDVGWVSAYVAAHNTGGTSIYVVINVNSNTTITQTSGIRKYLVDCTSGDIMINLATAVGNTSSITIKKIDATSNKIIVDGNGSQTIDGQLIQNLLFQYTSVTLFSDGANWYIE
jgi:hypothetical protein